MDKSGNFGSGNKRSSNNPDSPSRQRRRASTEQNAASPSRSQRQPRPPSPQQAIQSVLPHWLHAGPTNRPPHHHRPSGPGPSGGPPALFGFGHAMPVAVGGRGAVGLQIGVNPGPHKRVREDQGGNVSRNALNCSVCGKSFNSAKALFGHMRSHPDRGWKGAFPPPSFRPEEEFGDIYNPEPEGNVVALPVRREEEREQGDENQEAGNFKVPDLNNPPPRSDSD